MPVRAHTTLYRPTTKPMPWLRRWYNQPSHSSRIDFVAGRYSVDKGYYVMFFAASEKLN